MVAAWSGVSRPLPPGSTPTSFTASSGRNSVNMPMAFEPPPTQAVTTSGNLPSRARNCARASRPTMLWKSRTIFGNGCGPTTEPMA